MEGDPSASEDDPLLAQLCDELPDLAASRGAGRSVAPLPNNVMQAGNVPPPAGGMPMPMLPFGFGASMPVPSIQSMPPMPSMPSMPPPSISLPSGVSPSWTSSMFATMPASFPTSGEEAEEDEDKKLVLQPRVKCPYCVCGGRATNLGGAKKHKKYSYSCEEPACQQRWSQNRVPDANGDYDITPSKRAIGKEARRSGGYACGKCGAKPKWGHKCPYKNG
eukprot:7390730-Prymnesium_polylepis.1